MYTKTQSKFLLAFAFLLLLPLTGWIGQATAKGENDKFMRGYKSYLKNDFKMALAHWIPLAEAGNTNAQYFLGIMYLNGQGTKKNWAEAAHWFQASAEQGDVGAQYLFGEMNLKGMGLVRDYRKAGIWFQKAARQGYPDAQFRLGECYTDGEGCEANFILAYVWLKLAGANGIQAGDEKRKQVETRLTEQEIRNANLLAYRWWVRLEEK